MKTLYILVLAASMMISALFGESEAYAQDNKAGNVPGMHLLDEPNTIRVLGIGNSFKKHMAMNKAMMSARSQIAQQIETVVESTVDDYYVALEGVDTLISKRYINEKIVAASNQVLNGVRVIFNKLVMEDDMYYCYVVMELTPDDYAASVAASQGLDAPLDTVQLKKSLIKAINAK